MTKEQADAMIQAAPRTTILLLLLHTLMPIGVIVTGIKENAPKDSDFWKQMDDFERAFLALLNNNLAPMIEDAKSNPNRKVSDA